MRGQKKSKKVTWASDVNLCQVKLFLSEDSPSQVAIGAQDHLQARISLPLHAGVLVSDDNLPPGFEGAQPASLSKNKVAQIPVIKWRRPPSFVLDIKWRVVAGEESNDMEVQKQREMRVLEAIYPRESSIPPNPSMIPGEETLHNDQHTPVIPLTPVEEEEVADPSFGSAIPTNAVSSAAQVMQSGVPLSNRSARNNLPVHRNSSSGVVPGVEPDVVAAAQAALTALMADNGQANLIDHELLIKILSDPKIVGQLVTHRGVGTSSHSVPAMSTQSMSIASNMPNPRPQASSITTPAFVHTGRTDPPPVQVSRTELVMPSVAGASNGPYHSGPSRIGPVPSLRPRVPEAVSTPLPSPVTTVSTPSSSMPAPVARDINYYKSLIQQHGGERQETLPQYSNNRNNQQLSSVQESQNSLPPQYSNNRNNQQLGSVQESQNSLPPQYSNNRNNQQLGSVQESQNSLPPQYSNNRNNQQLGSVQESQNSYNSRDSKPKIMKPCIYFNSSRGCRHGANCAYMHDTSTQQRVGSLPEVQNSKRMKMDREITGT
ncbi:zinc finger CCCH domain-containing protein 6 [Lycium ferocissimum]|uniref:zinc finger CCCH domain-containing protein 6 n=1 Tax=Lycium ferocissimum TaxID=112874 RepID=UPI002815A093|nr:zinc finger CCCH domain-containing protein 6 [Lycium ferocissimum]